MFQYPHRIVGGFKFYPAIHALPDLWFQYPHRIVGGFKNDGVAPVSPSVVFQYPHRIVGGFKASCGDSQKRVIAFQYPHRIVGGFKSTGSADCSRTNYVSVSSSDRRGVQVEFLLCLAWDDNCFSILIGSSGGSRLLAALGTPVRSSFSILIGSSGGSRT